MGHDTFQIGDLTAVIGDNAEHESHRAGYNGVWSLQHRSGKRSLFVPGIAGLNFEHIISGEGEENREIFFEPRNAPMSFKRLSESECELHQPPTPNFQLESWTTFKLSAPHYIDITFRCRPDQHVFERGYIGLFWASYINAPEDKSFYFRGGLPGQTRPLWSQFCTQAHNRDSTIRNKKDKFEMTYSDDTRAALYKSFSPMQFDEPMFYGNFEDHTFIVMLDTDDGLLRLTHSPSGGGGNADFQTTNPAWDYQFIIPQYEVNEEYTLRTRAVFRERCSRSEVLKEWENWKR